MVSGSKGTSYESIQTCQKILCFIVSTAVSTPTMNSQLKGVSVGDLRKAMRPKPQHWLPRSMGTLMAEVQNKSTRNMWKYVEKLKSAFESTWVAFSRFEHEMSKSYWFLWMFFSERFWRSVEMLHCQRHGTFLVLPLPEEIQKGHKFCSESVSDRRYSGKEQRT